MRILLVFLAFAYVCDAQAETKFRRRAITCTEAKAQIALFGGPEAAEATARAAGVSEKYIATAKAKYRRCPA